MDHLVTIRRTITDGGEYDAIQNGIEAWLHEQRISYARGRASLDGRSATYAQRVNDVMLIHYRFSNHVDAAAFKMRWG